MNDKLCKAEISNLQETLYIEEVEKLTNFSTNDILFNYLNNGFPYPSTYEGSNPRWDTDELVEWITKNDNQKEKGNSDDIKYIDIEDKCEEGFEFRYKLVADDEIKLFHIVAWNGIFYLFNSLDSANEGIKQIPDVVCRKFKIQDQS